MSFAIQAIQPQLISNHRAGMKNQKAQSTQQNNSVNNSSPSFRSKFTVPLVIAGLASAIFVVGSYVFWVNNAG